MEQATFFPGANRRITLGSPTKQCSNGRIVFAVYMPLTGESFTSLPDWVGDGFRAVCKTFTECSPEVESVSDLALTFSNNKPTGELFAPPSAKIAGAELKGFKIVRVSEKENPEVELQFKVYVQYSREFWAWIGEMAGKEVYMAFPSSIGGTVAVAPKSEPLPLTSDPDSEPTMTAPSDVPEDPTMEEALGADFEAQVRQSMGAPEPFHDKHRMIDARPGRGEGGPRKPRPTGPKQQQDTHRVQ